MPHNPDPGPRTPDPGAPGGSSTSNAGDAERTVVLAARTLQALARLHFDLAPLLAVDHRIRLVYALNEGSDRRQLAERRALHLGIPFLPWKLAIEEHPDLVVSASAGPELHEAGAPVALIPHGATYNRLLKGLSGAAGTAREQLIGADGELPAFMAMPGLAAVDQLEADCPEASASAEVTGDLCMERLRRSTPLRRAYREALGVAPHRKLVVVSSSWGPYSLTATDRSLPEHLLSVLPADEFAVAYLPHPNLDADHRGNLLAYMRPRLHNGLIMIPPEEGWRAALIAADCVVGDSGSVTFYAANLGRPVLLAAFAFEEMAPGSPQEAFGRAAAWLRRGDDPGRQIREAIEERSRGSHRPTEFDVRPDHFAEFGDRPDYLTAAWSEPDPGPAGRITARLYELLGLSPMASEPELLELPERLSECRPMSAWHCDMRLDDDELAWARYPASHPIGLGRLVVRAECRVASLRGDAAVFLEHARDHRPDEVKAIAAELFAEYTQCRVVSVRIAAGEAIAVLREGARLRLECDPAVLDTLPAALLLSTTEAALRFRWVGGVGSAAISPCS